MRLALPHNIDSPQGMDDMDPGKTALVLFILMLAASTDGAIFSYKSVDDATKTLKKININHAKELLHRQRRAASTTGSAEELLSNEIVLNGTEEHSQAFVHWSGKLKSEAVFILTLKYNASQVTDSQTWRSEDYGTSYSKLNFGKDAVVTYFYVSPADHTKMVFTDVKNKRLYTSTDEMKITPQNRSLPVASDFIKMHQSNSDWMLLYDYYQRQLYVTMNFGQTWTLLQTDVNSRFFWGIEGYDDQHIVHMEIQPQDSEQAYYKRCTIPDCHTSGDGIDYNLGPFMTQTLHVVKEYMFVEKSHLDGTDSHMMVSYKRGDFGHTYFPNNVRTEDFLILNADEGQVFVAVNHGNRMGASLYLSDPSGRYYVLSLSSVHNRAIAGWFDIDLHEVQGLNGTYLANQQLKSSGPYQRKLKSLISFDKGGSWLEIPSPKKGCKSDDCALLLRLDMASYFYNWILSEERAPGLIIAHGHYGRKYDHDLKNMSVFTSYDGGWNWTETTLRGVYHFNILDQGGIVTAIKTGQDAERTNQTHYSYDEGQTWHVGNFGKKTLIVDGVLNEPSINTLVLNIFGHETKTAAWTMVKLNFSRVLSRKCVNSTADYISWMPSDHDKTVHENCLLGQQVSYWRRKRTSQCFNGETFVRDIKKQTCPCGEEDFECDFGYSMQGGECKSESWFDDGYIAANCTEKQKYTKSSGYRKVGSDKCSGGVETDSKYQPDPNAVCPLVAPSHLLLVANVSIVATGKPIHFHLSQRKGSNHTTKYIWNFNVSKTASKTLTGLKQGQQQTYNFSAPGIYYVSVTAQNDNGKASSNLVRINVEDAVHTVGVFRSWAAKVGFPVKVSVSTNVNQSNIGSNLHFMYRFGDETDAVKDLLLWDSKATHTYNKSGTYTVSVTAVNHVSAVTKQVTIKVIDDGVMLRLGFSRNVDKLFKRDSYYSGYSEYIFVMLEVTRQELALMLGVELDRLDVSLNSTSPASIDVLVVPPPAKSNASEMTTKQIVKTIFDMVGNKSLTLFKNSGIPKSYGDINITSVIVLKRDGGNSSGHGGGDSSQKTGANYRAVYIAIPIVLLAAIVTVLVLIYYRRRFRSMRRYTMVSQHEDTDALLDDDEDEPPLDLRSDSRDEGRSRDDHMLDLGSGSHLVMVTGTGGGDSAENC